MTSLYTCGNATTQSVYLAMPLPTDLDLKARHFGGCTFSNFRRFGVPEQARGGLNLGFRIVVEDRPRYLKHGFPVCYSYMNTEFLGGYESDEVVWFLVHLKLNRLDATLQRVYIFFENFH